jgi:hypothetical protein
MRLVLPAVFALAALAAAPAHAEMIGGNAGPEHNYVCPHADGKPPLDCYLDAVRHLYTMCRNVKSIEIIEFGYEKATEGTNGAKSESCLEKQKQNIEKPYRAALREVAKSQPTVEALRHLQQTWLTAMNELKWHPGESDSDYKARVEKPYEAFDQGIATIRTDVAAAETHAPAKKATHAAKSKAKPAAKTKTAATSKTTAATTKTTAPATKTPDEATKTTAEASKH